MFQDRAPASLSHAIIGLSALFLLCGCDDEIRPEQIRWSPPGTRYVCEGDNGGRACYSRDGYGFSDGPLYDRPSLWESGDKERAKRWERDKYRFLM